jgi:hypothetical protein
MEVHRNHYTHFGDPKGRIVMEGFELNYLANKVMLLLFSALLRSCGVAEEKLEPGLKKNFMWMVGRR